MFSAGSSYRDRTSEFRSLSNTLKRFGSTVGPTTDDPSTSTRPQQRSEFSRKASRIGSRIHDISNKIAHLGSLTKKSSIFDDPLKEIEEKTVLIKAEITTLNVEVSDLQTLQSMEMADGNYSKDRGVHSTAICEDLKNRLVGATRQFHDVLTTRTENIKAHENRKQLFSSSRENQFRKQANNVTEPLPWSGQMNSSQSHQPMDASGVGNQLRRRLAPESTPSHQMEVSMLQQVVPRQDDQMQGFSSALQNVESTISELSGIFTNLTSLVAHQGELAIRIDDNMEESLANVEGARSALLKHLNQISSNRWLLIKIFAILIFFLTIFLFFIA